MYDGFSITDDTAPGWQFRIDEISPGGYAVEGRDMDGRQVGRQGGDPDDLLQACLADAIMISRSVKARG